MTRTHALSLRRPSAQLLRPPAHLIEPAPDPEPGPDREPPLLRSVGLTKVFQTDGGPVHAVRGVDLWVRRGEFVAVMGPSGSGKSTLLHLLGGLEPATGGEIWLDGKRADGLTQAKWARLRRRHIGFVFQFFNLVSSMSVADNVEVAALVGGANHRQARERREELLEDLGLTAKAQAVPSQLSGGEQQRVAVARALAHRPSLLLTDEPTGNLDSANTAAVLRLLRRSHTRGQAILLVTHDARAASMADRVINLFDGMIVDDAAVQPATLRGVAASSVLELRG
jgi:putative ABC transport system ATP-binding protein